MKFGLLIASTKNSHRSDSFVNIGDTVQTIGIYEIFKRMGIADADMVYVNYYDLRTYDGEYVFLPINFLFQTDYQLMPFSERIIPCFVSLSLFATEDLTPDVINYLNRYEPIGCRDMQTMLLLRRHGISAYLAGCMSATLPQRSSITTGGVGCQEQKVFLVDLPRGVKEKLPSEIVDNAEEVEHIFRGDQYDDPQLVFETARRLLNRYRDEARLVVTGRLHCLSPCMAMGIPTVGLFADITPRMAWIDKLTQLYTADNVDEIDWNVQPSQYEDVKARMISICIRRLEAAYSECNDRLTLSNFFEDADRKSFGKLLYARTREVPFARDDEFEYIVWGCGQIGLRTVEVMKECFPNAKFVGAIDTYSKAQFFEGLPVERPHCIKDKYMDALCIIASYTGEAFAKDFLSKIAKNNVVSFSSVNG